MTDDVNVRLSIEAHEDTLMRNLVLSKSVLDAMVQEKLLSPAMMDIIKSKKTNEEQLAKILDITKHSGPITFRKFIRVLKVTMHGWLASLLEEHSPSETTAVQPNTALERNLPHDVEDELENFKDEKMKVLQFSNQENTDASLQPSRMEQTADILTLQHGDQTPDDVIPPADDSLQSLMIYFENQKAATSSVLASLKEEEKMIKRLLSKNQLDQQQYKFTEYTLNGICDKLKRVQTDSSTLSGLDLLKMNERLDHIKQLALQ
ncbi:uncharacterized protein LOC106151801 [Lingula anatina]|uniref:Uncharacterized protein LOC106151801 n=1 Tax=Lingula anatina TaxID=7574 RepID=A0A1S3H3F8_LINAN|nr:uncharacterized protein LOC106151801 [Lingula anatina]|eukprot:XP_013380670.1 uncharacterized protein LOC106151801 [Lingula anatina]